MRGGPRVLVGRPGARPFCCGLLRGTVVLPPELVQPRLAARLEAVLLHELAHLAQHHPRARLLAALAAPALYWNPLYWWLARQLRLDGELLADDMAVRRLDRRRYVAELLDLAQSAGRARALPHPGPGALGSGKDFLKRMETLLMRRSHLATRSSRFHVTARTLGAFLVVGSIAVAWGRPLQEGGEPPPIRAARPASPSIGAAAAGVADSPSRRRPAPAAPGELEMSFEVRDAQALGAALFRLADGGLGLAELRLDPAAADADGRLGRARVAGTDVAGLASLCHGVPGFTLTAIRADPGEAAPVDLPDALGQELAELEACIQNLLTLQRELEHSLRAEAPPATWPVGAREAYVLQDDRLLATDLTALRERPAGTPISGSVLATYGQEDQRTVVALDRGRNHGVTRDMMFEVYRGATYKGRVRVLDVREELSVGVVDREVDGAAVEVGDKVTTDL